jgi:curved DNA-binding protein
VPHTFRVTIPKGAKEAQRLRLTGKGAPGRNGGKPGDLYTVLHVDSANPLYRVCGSDLNLDHPLAPWEAVLGAGVEVPTPGGPVELNIRPGTLAGQRVPLARRGLPSPNGEAGDLYAVARIELSGKVVKRDQELYKQLAAVSKFNPRKHFREKAE